MTLSAKLYLTEDPDERRAAPRRPVALGTTLRLSGVPVDVLLHDLSETGALIETAVSIAEGSTVTIGLAGVGRFEARLVSRNGSRYGCQFLTPLSTAQAGSAFRTDPIVPAPFAATGPIPFEKVDDVLVKWPGAVRVALPVGIALAGWVMVIELVWRSLDG